MTRLRVLLLKEWRESMRNKMVLFGVIFLPLVLVGMSIFMLTMGEGADDPSVQIAMFNTSLMYFMVLPAVIPLAIAVYSIVGEKEQSTLEPLLASPVTDLELFLGKALASVLPAVAINWASFGIFIAVMRLLTGGLLVQTVSTTWLVAIFGLTPLLAFFSIGVTMIVSSRASDARAAYQISSLAILPGLIPLIVYSSMKTLVDLRLVLLEAVVLLVVGVVVLWIAIRLFKREQILTRWK